MYLSDLIQFISYLSVLFAIFTISNVVTSEFNPFDDSLVFRIHFPGPRNHNENEEKTIDINESKNKLIIHDESSFLITSVDNEKYKCIWSLPSNNNFGAGTKLPESPSPFQLLKPLFSQIICSYKLEQYWTYELCHGKFLRQYHEENNLQGSHLQEYVLGLYDVGKLKDDLKYTDTDKSNIPTIKIDNQEIPYIEINMTDGTQCELSGNSRFSRILYVCGEKKHDIFSLKETSSCEYEVIILTSLLCKHPNYRIKNVQENDIFCYAVNGSPNKPVRLLALENEQEETIEEKEKKQDSDYKSQSDSTPHDPKIIEDFLKGDYCLHGGIGWWKYEFCYGRKVEQYHEEKDKHRITILLGKWNIQHHLKWLEQNPTKRPKLGIIPRQISHFYSEGTTCDITGKPRQVEVRLKCKEVKGHPDFVSIYLSEPKTCEYVLGVESPVICPLLETVDENGIFRSKS